VEKPAPQGPAGSRTARDLALCALVAAISFAAYFPSLSGAFIWNDSDYVTAPPLRGLGGLWRIWTDLGSTQQYYPLLHSFFWLQHRLFGDHPLGYHLTNVALHAAAAILLAFTLRLLFEGSVGPGGNPRSASSGPYRGFEWLAALLFAVHPVHAETVAWITEEKNTLSLVFYLGAAAAYLRFDAAGRRGAYWAASCLFVLSLLCKTVTATLPAALLVGLWWKRGRLSRPDFRRLGPWLAFGAAAGLFSSWVERRFGGAQGPEFTASMGERVIVAGRSVLFYLGNLLWPFRLDFIYPKWRIDASDPLEWLWPAAALGLGAALWALRGRSRAPLAAYLFFVGSLFPVLGFVNLYGSRYSWVWDHWQYLPDIGPIALAAAALVTASGRLPPSPRWARPAAAAAILAALGSLAWAHSVAFRDDDTLYRSNLALNPGSWLSQDNLGVEMQAAGDRQEAIRRYREAIRLDPLFAEAQNNLGTALALEPGKSAEAIAAYEEAIRLKPDFADARYNLANELNSVGRHDEAVAQYRSALAVRPADALARYNLANTLLAMGRSGEAVSEYEACVAANPAFAAARNNLGRALAAQGRLAEAVAQYQEALRLQPDLPEAHANLGLALASMPGRMAEAVAQLETAIRERPDYADAHYYLANALADEGDGQGAAEHFVQALRIRPDYAEASSALGMLLCRSGHPEEGMKLIDAAVRLDPGLAQAHFARAAALLQAGRLSESIDELNIVLRLHPGDPAAGRMLELIHSRQ
jgi:tetratricopeptide (TPR) repeat protein